MLFARDDNKGWGAAELGGRDGTPATHHRLGRFMAVGSVVTAIRQIKLDPSKPLPLHDVASDFPDMSDGSSSGATTPRSLTLRSVRMARAW